MTKTFFSALAVTAAVILALPASAAFAPASKGLSLSVDGTMTQELEKRRPRVPGGSGCDSAHDIAEHPECRA